MLDRFRKAVHPLILKMMPGRRNFKLEVLTLQPYVQGNKIYVMNHSTAHDIPIACEVIKEHFYVLVGKQRLEILDRLFFWLNGVVYIDRKNKKNKKRGFNKMLKILNAGNNLLIYPEGTWNITPSKPMLPLNWGVIELAKKTSTPIIPLVAEYYSDCCYVKFGKPIYFDEKMNKKMGIQQVEDALATLKWEIWEMFPIEKRREQMKEEFELMIEQRLMEYPKLNLEYELSVIRGWENDPGRILGKY